ncbi:MAG: hypothetical protein RL660_2240 [Bacteroidota bacterium]|jgi:hypothetical protein
MRGWCKLFSATILLLIIAAACKKAGEIPPIPDLEAPQITITKPQNQTAHNSEEPINLIGTVVDEFGVLNTLTIDVMTADSFKRVQYFAPDVLGKKGYVFHEQYVMALNNGGIPTPFILAVVATDSSGNRATDSVTFIAY